MHESYIHSHGAKRLKSSAAASSAFQVATDTCGMAGWLARRLDDCFSMAKLKPKHQAVPIQESEVRSVFPPTPRFIIQLKNHQPGETATLVKLEHHRKLLQKLARQFPDKIAVK